MAEVVRQGRSIVTWEYRNLQVRTVPTFGMWSRISGADLRELERLQQEGWEVYHSVNIRGSFGFTSYVLFMLRRARKSSRVNEESAPFLD